MMSLLIKSKIFCHLAAHVNQHNILTCCRLNVSLKVYI